jgi:beta-lactamase class A
MGRMPDWHLDGGTRNTLLLAAGLAFIGGLFLPIGINAWDDLQKSRCHERLSLLNPTRRCQDKPQPPAEEYEVFGASLRTWIEEQKEEGVIENASVYFRDLQSGSWFGINEREHYSPASLLKVPIMVALLKEAEEQPDILDTEIVYEDAGSIQNVADVADRLVPGTTYTVRELMRRMIAYSDNASKDILEQYLSQLSGGANVLGGLYDELGLIREEEVPQASLNVKGYASIMRMLYNASFLSPEYSQYALELLSETDFNAGLIGGTPEDALVAHKFGSRPLSENARQLHDCGIVYRAGYNYLLCVMTQGPSDANDARVIQQVAKAVYEEVDRRVRESR